MQPGQEGAWQQRLPLLIDRRVTQHQPAPRPRDGLIEEQHFVGQQVIQARERQPGLAKRLPLRLVEDLLGRHEQRETALAQAHDENVVRVERARQRRGQHAHAPCPTRRAR